MSQLFQHSAFDTEIFGFKVAKILPARLGLEQLTNILAALRRERVHLAIWIADSSDRESIQAANNCGGFFGVEQVTYKMQLAEINSTNYDLSGIKSYEANKATTELEQLAFAAGSLSHFRADPRCNQNAVDNLYKKWIENSVNGSHAKKVLVIWCGGKIGAMITLDEKDGCGDIGLLGVAESCRGQKLGETLVRAAQVYFKEAGFSSIQVVTQVKNLPARKLYEKCGFHAVQFSSYFHFWLSENS